MIRLGHGYDVHRLVTGRKLVLGGVEVPFDQGLLGHSDADVLLHAISDAIIGALGLGDIGKHFPDSDHHYKDIDSREILRQTAKIMQQQGYRIANVDTTIVAQKPKLATYIIEMKSNIASDLLVTAEQINVKATTTELLGYVGRGEGIAAHAVVALLAAK